MTPHLGRRHDIRRHAQERKGAVPVNQAGASRCRPDRSCWVDEADRMIDPVWIVLCWKPVFLKPGIRLGDSARANMALVGPSRSGLRGSGPGSMLNFGPATGA